jgi:phage antirepressor YoqD-like protein
MYYVKKPSPWKMLKNLLRLIASHVSITPGVFAKRFRQIGFRMGLNRFYKRLRKWNLLMKDNSSRRHVPTQKGMELGLFELATTVTNNGALHVDTRFWITAKGQLYLTQKFLDERNSEIATEAAGRQITLPISGAPALAELKVSS